MDSHRKVICVKTMADEGDQDAATLAQWRNNEIDY